MASPFQPLISRFERLVDPYPEAPGGAPVQALPTRFFAFLWRCADGVRPQLVAVMLLTAGIAAAEAWLFSLMASLVDWLATLKPGELWTRPQPVVLTLVGVLAVSVALAAVQALTKYQAVFGNFPMRLRWIFHRRMLAQSLAFFGDEFAGRIATKVMQTALAVRDTWLIVVDILVYVAVYFGTLVAIVAGFDAWLMLPFAGWLALYLVALRFFVPRLGRIAQAQADARSLMTGRITDAYTNIATVKLFAHGRREAAYAKSAMQDFMLTAYGQMRLVTGFEVVNSLLSALLVGSTALLSLWLWGVSAIGVGAVAAATAMAMRLNGISHWVMWEMASLFEHIGTVQDGLATLSKPQTVVDAAGAKALAVPRGEVRFENLRFAYPNGKVVVDGLDLTIRPGEKIGLVGRSGAGKSTLVNLLLRLHDLPQDGGRILIDGQDIRTVTQDSLRRHIGMVTQDTSLLHRSVADNILYGRPDATREDLERAAERAHADEFIAQLSDPKGRVGLEAHVGERGVKLSGGQRQRIAIARVMLKDAPILLLDEATSALDSEVEAAIQQSLYTLMEGKTVVAIAHRLSTIAALDRLVVMDAGRIVEQGSHAELLAQGGIYARLWAHQSGGFLGLED
ncbi:MULTISPECIES: ABC transporter ATP-binding protein [Roseateles]|uniref:ABC transporter ATP-binding protein/permease n=1 Tax=Pelomonas caseinilytica TaxID=2906763 RepID=A0ABS8XME4_9BURK|nr:MULTISPECIES: ABC transporter ATP-binding protein [unclassified Roseateles]MCE4540243.1 ABC transporter ATP-binding protein/permease [Pelomonas sp. P7]HEV6966807.1 ABC transporter ATP-binding protein [Roseateles sp.]